MVMNALKIPLNAALVENVIQPINSQLDNISLFV